VISFSNQKWARLGWSRLSRRVAIAVALLGAAACYREVSGDPQYARFAGDQLLAVRGVRPGLTAEEVVQLWGDPSDKTPSMGVEVWKWTRAADTSVTVDAEGRVVEVFGSELSAGGRTLVWAGASEAEVGQILGRGKVSEHRQPSGYVISVGSKLVGKTLTYVDRGVRVEITLVQDGVRSVRLTAESAAGGRKRR
jgi:hypothetical protein